MIGAILVVAAAVSSPDPGVAAYLSAEGIEVAKVAKVPKRADDRAWSHAAVHEVLAHPQRTMRLPDKTANAHLLRAPTPVQVRALHDGTSLSVKLTWPDDTETRPVADAASFGDAAAMELPVTFGRGVRLPYIGMGDAGQNVLVYLLRTAKDGSYGREYTGAGFGSLTRTNVGGFYGDITYSPAQKMWQAVFVRRLTSHGHTIARGAVPVAFAVWNGALHERGGNKALTSWKTLHLQGLNDDAAYLKELSFGYGEGEYGDPAAGKAMVESMCIACHHVGDKALVPAELAPSLQSVGGIATYRYLYDSITNPNQILVPNPNKNRHHQVGGPQDPYGALPHNPGFSWSVDMGGGKTNSKMPPFALPKEQVLNMVAYLKPRPEK